jgi:hypothetical protein
MLRRYTSAMADIAAGNAAAQPISVNVKAIYRQSFGNLLNFVFD